MPKEIAVSDNPGWTIFFVYFMMIGCFFFLNLFVAVVINTFNQEQSKVEGSELLSDKQKEWIDLRLLVLRSEPIIKVRPPNNFLSRVCFKVISHRYFDRAIQTFILLNTVILMISWNREDPKVQRVEDILNAIFTVIFATEAVLRICGEGPRHYFNQGWNVFDFIIALGSFIGLLIAWNSSVAIKGTTILRAFRIMRFLRLLRKGGKSLYLIFNTFIITLQSLINIGGLLILILYVYSIIGMIYFGEVKRNGRMNDYLNFESFTSAFITLFTVATADTWNLTMAAFTQSLEPWYQCIANPSYHDYKDNGYEM